MNATRSSVPFWISASRAVTVSKPSFSRAERMASITSSRELKIATRGDVRGVTAVVLSPRHAGHAQMVRASRGPDAAREEQGADASDGSTGEPTMHQRGAASAPRDGRHNAEAGAPSIVPLRRRADSDTTGERWTSPSPLSRTKNIFYCSYISRGHFGCVWRGGGDSGRVAKPRACSSGSAAPPPLLSGPFLSSARVTTLTLACHRRTRARGAPRRSGGPRAHGRKKKKAPAFGAACGITLGGGPRRRALLFRRANDLGPLRVSRRARGRLARAADAWPARHSSGGRGTLPAPGSGHARTRRLVQRTGSRKGISREASALSVGHRRSREGPGRPDRNHGPDPGCPRRRGYRVVHVPARAATLQRPRWAVGGAGARDEHRILCRNPGTASRHAGRLLHDGGRVALLASGERPECFSGPYRLLRRARLGGVRQGPSGRVAASGRRHVVVERIRPRWRRASLGPRRRGRVRAADPGLARAVRRLWAEQFYAGCAVGGLAQVVRRPAGGAEAGESCW